MTEAAALALARDAAERLGALALARIPPPLPVPSSPEELTELATAVNRLVEQRLEARDFVERQERSAPGTLGDLLADGSRRPDFTAGLVQAFDQVIAELDRKDAELKEKIAELEGLNRQKDEFVGIAAHDLRSPLSVIEMYSAFLYEAPGSGLAPREREFMRVIRRQSRFMLNLINDLLDVSIIESGHLSLHPQPGDWLEFVRRNAALNAALASRREIQVVVPDPAGPAPILLSFDPNRMEQVLNNLVGNAVKFSPPGGTVTVSVAREGGVVRTSVADRGPGIPAAEQTGIFADFHRGSNRPASGERGTGLGLAIARRIVEAHGGVIGLASEVGRGSTFFFTLPALPDKEGSP